MKFKILFLPLIFLSLSSFCQTIRPKDQEISINKYVTGNLLVPSTEENLPLVIIIQGSGPTDRDGNNPQMTNNSLKMLAQGLAENGIASFRYDKRISKMQALGIPEKELRFNDFITDAVSVLDYFETKEKFDKIVVLGHSQGSLIGMLAAKNKADAFISVAGAAQPIDSIITEQLIAQAPFFEENIRNSFKEMRKNGSTSSYNPALASIFRPNVQPFLLSWMNYNPSEEIAKLDIPVLIINGTLDLQVKIKEAQKLKESNPDATLILLDNMNHVLKKIEDPTANLASYNNSEKPLHPELIPTISKFIKELE